MEPYAKLINNDEDYLSGSELLDSYQKVQNVSVPNGNLDGDKQIMATAPSHDLLEQLRKSNEIFKENIENNQKKNTKGTKKITR